MAKSKNALDRLDMVSKQLIDIITEVDELRTELQVAMEMNTQLRLENGKLRERLEEMYQSNAEKQSTSTSGHDSLEQIYADGFHVCTAFYGQHRDSKDECFFCTELLDRE